MFQRGQVEQETVLLWRTAQDGKVSVYENRYTQLYIMAVLMT